MRDKADIAGQGGQYNSLEIVHYVHMSNSFAEITPPELSRELGHREAKKAGRRVRTYLRQLYPEHPKNKPWLLTPAQADDVRLHFRGRSA